MSIGRKSSTGSPLNRTRKKTAVSARKTTRTVWARRDRRYARTRRVYPRPQAGASSVRPRRCGRSRSGALEDMQASAPVDQIEQSTLITADVVAADSLLPLRRAREEGRHFSGSVRIGDVDDS